MLAAAVDFMDGPNGILNRCIVEQTWDQRFERFPCAGSPLRLALSPLISVGSVKHFDADGVEQTVSSSDYEAITDGDRPLVNAFDAWPAIDTRRTYPVTVRYTVGFATVPAALKEALMLHVSALYNGGAVSPLGLAQLGYHDLIAGHRRPSL